MYLDSAKKKEIFEKYGKSATNTVLQKARSHCSQFVSHI